MFCIYENKYKIARVKLTTTTRHNGFTCNKI